ncbi:MAG: aspartate aminotransferase family protein [Promethearchaeota archaeon]
MIGSAPQKALLRTYAKHVSRPKADFFKSVGLGVVQGRREGIYLESLEGPRKGRPPLKLVDCRTAGGVFNLGHRHPAILAALREGIEAGLDVGDHHLVSEQRALLAKQLADLMPGDLNQTQFCASGGEAVDLAIKLAFAATGRKKVVSANRAYHGVTGLALAAGSPRFQDPFGWHLPGFEKVEFGDVEALEAAVDDQTACVIFETIPATGGILVPPEGYFARARELCDDTGAVLVADEVQAGLGRTGVLWAIHGGLYPDEKVVPDAIVLAKGMSAGVYPLATVTYRPFLGEVFAEDPFVHISTTGGAELGCFVARRMLELVSSPEILSNVRDRGRSFERRLNELQERHPALVRDVRGRGLMWGVELPNDRYGVGFTLRMIERGVWADYCGNDEKTVKLMPPLVITEDDVEEVFSRIEPALASLPPP